MKLVMQWIMMMSIHREMKKKVVRKIKIVKEMEQLRRKYRSNR
jgi:hypothetical protein